MTGLWKTDSLSLFGIEQTETRQTAPKSPMAEDSGEPSAMGLTENMERGSAGICDQPCEYGKESHGWSLIHQKGICHSASILYQAFTRHLLGLLKPHNVEDGGSHIG